MKFNIFSLTLLFTLIPTISHAQVLLSEIAWMGTDASPTAEWIELYNFSTTPTDLTGWTLTSDDGSVSITLSGTLTPHGVGLLERGTDSAVPGVTALLTYNGEMSDAGGTLTLKDNTGATVDGAPGGSAWAGIGGKGTAPVKTAQRTRMGAWVTAAPTPGLDNAQVSDPIVDTTVGTTTSTTLPTVGGSITRSGGGGGSAKRDPLTIVRASSTALYVGKPVTFSTGNTSGRTTLTHGYYWNFGDAETAVGKTATHTYQFPGEYVVMVEATSTRNKPTTARLDVEVLPYVLALGTTTDGNITLTNISDTEFILDGYTITGDSFSLTFPRNSILKSKASYTLLRTKLGGARAVEVTDPEQDVVVKLILSPQATLTTSTPSPTNQRFAAGKRQEAAPAKTTTAVAVPATPLVLIEPAAPTQSNDNTFARVLSNFFTRVAAAFWPLS